jgi:uncharacterized protein YbjT (DUF2867 family)
MGGSGLTGQHVVKHLLDQGHEVTAFVRTASKLTVEHARLSVVQGEARDAASIDRAVQGQDAVMSAFGPRLFQLRRGDVQEMFMRNVVAAMTSNGVKRLVNLSGWGVGDSLATMPFAFRNVIAPVVLGRFFADKEAGEDHLFASALEYVNVRPGRLTNAAARGGVRASPTGRGLRGAISREDVALFMIAQLQSSEWVRTSPVIGY